MIDHDVMERYLSESTLKMTAASKVNLENLLIKFFVCNQKKDIQREVTYARKYNEYQEFKRCLDL